jgi:hypothetical protein
MKIKSIQAGFVLLCHSGNASKLRHSGKAFKARICFVFLKLKRNNWIPDKTIEDDGNGTFDNDGVEYSNMITEPERNTSFR